MALTPTQTRELLARLGHTPKRFLGQNFLVDGNIVRKSLDLAQVRSGDTVVEVGPGLGVLTEALLEAGAEVWAVEKDDHLYAHLKESLVPRFSGLTLTHGDAIDLPLAALPEERAAAGFKIVANLPYAISTPWMDGVLSGPLPERMVLMLQREAADRYAADHGSKSFGAISIFLRSAYDIAPGHAVSAACFHPRPDIDSFLLNLVRKGAPVVFPSDRKLLIRNIFQQRRKQVGALIRDRAPELAPRWLEQLTQAGLSGQARAEDIPLPLWQRLVAD
jgi:16S rRNA (adenine1518-N6/adenine1519-N6)-dimethyltransferase